MHLRSEAGETSTTGNGEPSPSDGLAECCDLRLEAFDADDDRFEPGGRAERPRNLDGAGQRLAAMAAARVVMADDMRDADGAEPPRIGERRGGVIRVEAEAEVGSRALLRAERRRGPRFPPRRGAAARPIR